MLGEIVGENAKTELDGQGCSEGSSYEGKKEPQKAGELSPCKGGRKVGRDKASDLMKLYKRFG